jgi:LysM repeat protein
MSGAFGPSPSPCFGPHGATGLSMRSGIRDATAKLTAPQPEPRQRCLRPLLCDAKLRAMKLGAFLVATFACGVLHAQSPSPENDAALSKKVDEINTKLDALSQQILKIEQQLDHVNRPGVMIGEATPPAGVPAAPGESAKPSGSAAGNSHTIAKGETLTSIAKMHKVPIDELQKFNHIENDRKLQVGQTIMIPGPSASPSASASVSAAPTTP